MDDMEVQLERMRKAVKVFRTMQPMLTAYARAVTGNRKVRVVLSSSSASTDGTNIYFRPPLALGEDTVHDKRVCDKRDPETYIQLCKACAVREEVHVNIYHEIGHIAFESFAAVSDHDKKYALTKAAEEMGGKYADALKKRLDQNADNSYLGLSNYVNPYLHGLFGAVEDARVDGKMFDARRGIRVMLQASTLQIFKEGTNFLDGQKLDEDVKTWFDAPLNAQVAIACIMRIDAYRGWEPYLNPDVVRHTGMPNVQAVLDQLAQAKTVDQTFRLALPLMEELRQYGYFQKPEEIPPDSPPSSDDTDDNEDDSEDDSNEGDGDDPDDSEESDSQESDDGDEGAEDGASSDATRDDDADDASDSPSSGDPDEDETGSSSSDNGDQESQDEGSSSDQNEDAEGSDEVDGDDSPEGTGSDPGTDSSDEDGSGGGDQQEDSDSPEDSEGDEGQPSEGGDGSDAGESGSDSNGDVADDRGDSEEGEAHDDHSSDGADGEADDSDESPGGTAGSDGEAESDGSSGDQSSDSSDGTDSDGGDGDGSDGDQADDGTDGDAEAGDQDDAGGPELPEGDRPDEGGLPDDEEVRGDVPEAAPPAPDHQHGVDGQPCDCGYCQTYGTPDDLDQLVHQLHDGLAKLQEPTPLDPFDPFEQEDTDRDYTKYIDQSLHMDKPSEHIEKVNVYKRGDPEGAHFFRDEPVDEVVSESVVGGALLHARKAFADNDRASQEVNLKRGQVRTSTLGRRAWQNDPRLFQRSRQPGRKDYSVLVGIDLSSSSVGEEHELIRKCAMAQCSIMNRLGIRFAVYGHSGNRYHTKDWRGEIISSTMAMDIVAIKEFDEPWSEDVQNRMKSVRPHGANLDGHTLEFYRKRLDEEATTDRILMYYTDGLMPYANREEELEVLEREIKTCQQKSYTLMGVEIGDGAQCPPELDTVKVLEESDVKKVVKHLEKRLANG
jgi:hypothetical protein